MDTLIIFAVLATLPEALSQCTFPPDLQNSPDNENDHWNFQTNSFLGVNTIVKFKDNTLDATKFAYETPNSERSETCEEYFPESDTYLLKSTSTGNYTCVIFERETENVYSYKQGEETPVRDTNCTLQELQYHPWLLHANSPRTGDPVPWHHCPLEGAFRFVATSVDEIGIAEETCPEHPSESVLDMQCMPGDGATLTFAHASCVPPNTGWGSSDGTLSARLQCLDHWTDDTYHYGLLGDEYYLPKWSVRVPLVTVDSFTMELYLEIIRPDDSIIHNTPYVLFNMSAISPHSLCVDDLPDCDINYCGDPSHDRVCRKSCDACENATALPSCEFGRPFYGDWTQYTDAHSSDVIINSENLTVQYFGQFSCAEEYTPGTYVTRTSFENGCLPQHSCVSFEAETTPIMKYKIGQALEEASAEVLCDSDKFTDDRQPLNDTYRSKYSKVLIDDVKINSLSSQCALGGIYTLEEVEYGSEAMCTGNLTDVTSSPYEMDIAIKCESTYSFKFRCVHYLSLDMEDTRALLTQDITDISNNTTKYRDDELSLNCWLFHSEDDVAKKFYVLDSPQCNQATMDDVTSGKRQPIIIGVAHFFSSGVMPSTEETDTAEPVTSRVVETVTPPTTQPVDNGSTAVLHNPPSRHPAGRIVGIVFGSLIGAALLGCVIFLAYRFYSSQRQPYRIL